MALENRLGSVDLHGLARVEREKRWTTIMDTVLAVTVLAWLAGVVVDGLMPRQAHWLLPVAIASMLAHRLLVVAERRHRERLGVDVRRAAVRAGEPRTTRSARAEGVRAA